jgi:UDP-N-acetylglucosamine--dolichyl-phosphate N-acetylglucosaminephosphotransferase
MLAGLNGLEAGLGFINAITLLIIAAILGEIEVVIIMLGLMGALIAFMRFNWFPAKIFPGDSLTLMVGAGIAAAVIIGNMEKIGLLLFILYFVEFILKARRKFQGQSFGVPQENGTLHAPAHIDSLTHVAMRLGKGRLNEQQVVMVLLGLQVVVAIITFALFYANFSAHPFSPVRGLI